MTGVVYRVFQRKLKMEELLRRMQVVFLEAMLHGWVGGNHGVLVPNNPGFKESVYEKDGLRVVDRYGTIEEKATGTTTIWEGGKQLWYMSYSGHYRKEDLPFFEKGFAKRLRKRRIPRRPWTSERLLWRPGLHKPCCRDLFWVPW